MEFPIERAILTKSEDGSWNFEAFSEELRLERFNNEMTSTYIGIGNLNFSDELIDDLQNSGGDLSDHWVRTQMDRVNDTYFTFSGEGFPIWSCRILIRCVSEGIYSIQLKGETDYPIDGVDLVKEPEMYAISLQSTLELVRQ